MSSNKPDSPQFLIPSAAFLMLDWVAHWVVEQPSVQQIGLQVHVADFNEQMVKAGSVLPALYFFPLEKDVSGRIEGTVFRCRAWLLTKEATADLASPMCWAFADMLQYAMNALAMNPHRGGPVRLPSAGNDDAGVPLLGQPVEWLKLQKNGLILGKFRGMSPRTMDGFAIAHGQWEFVMVCSAPSTWSDFGGGLLPPDV